MKKLLSLLLLTILLSSTSSYAFAPIEQLPDQVLLDLDGEPQPFNQWKGEIVILNFWATWCPPCRREMPSFIELQEQYGAQGVQFVGVAIDNPKMAQRYGSDHGINFPTLQGEQSGLDLSMMLGNHRSVLPYTVIFDRSGKVVSRRSGEIRHKEILATITPLL